MKIAAWVRTSLVDYPGRIAAVLFTQGCNLRCGYCHNRELWEVGASRRYLIPEEILAYLERRKGLLEGVVVTGGEPTLQIGLQTWLHSVRQLGYPVKLDTNGTVPALLEELVGAGLVDYLALDVKAPPELYGEICGRPVDLTALERSIRLIRSAAVPGEFRTTLAPGLDRECLGKIQDWIGGPEHWVLQRYRALGETAGRDFTPVVWDQAELQSRFTGCKLRGFN